MLKEIEVTLGDPEGSHHGDPALFERDIKICSDLILWMRVAKYETANGFHPNIEYGEHWYPSYADCLKSRLFWRIRAKKPILKHAPPTAMSCPWYELIEEPDRPHWIYETPRIFDKVGEQVFNPKKVSIAGSDWFDLIEQIDDSHYVVGFKPWTFDLFEGPNACGAVDISGNAKVVHGWWLQRRKEEGEDLYITGNTGPDSWEFGDFPAFHR